MTPSLWTAPWGTASWPGPEAGLAAGAAVALAGATGMVVDSYLGAALEGRVRWIDNEVVNLLATSSGAAAALLASAA